MLFFRWKMTSRLCRFVKSVSFLNQLEVITVASVKRKRNKRLIKSNWWLNVSCILFCYCEKVTYKHLSIFLSSCILKMDHHCRILFKSPYCWHFGKMFYIQFNILLKGFVQPKLTICHHSFTLMIWTSCVDYFYHTFAIIYYNCMGKNDQSCFQNSVTFPEVKIPLIFSIGQTIFNKNFITLKTDLLWATRLLSNGICFCWSHYSHYFNLF